VCVLSEVDDINEVDEVVLLDVTERECARCDLLILSILDHGLFE